jgi:hypothetical protein
MATMKWTHDWVKEIDNDNFEYLFLMEKNKTHVSTVCHPWQTAIG